MSLATRCAACGTVFRVVQDQLKVSEGWVRCGRCADVFNALEGLFDLDRETAPAWTPSQRGALDLLPASADERAAQTTSTSAPVRPEAHTAEAGSGTSAAEDTEIDTHVDSQTETRGAADDRDDDDDNEVGRGEAWAFDSLTDDAQAPLAESRSDSTPAFLRQAESAAFWQRPLVRVLLSSAAMLLGLLLAAQAAVWQRDLIVVRWPVVTPLLANLCSTLGCRIEPLRRLDGLAVESSGLTQLDSPSLYRLHVALRNHDEYPLLTPALDVTLTDSRGEVVARRVVGQRDFGLAPSTTVAPGAELPLQVVLDAGERRITGYSIEIFYP